MARAPLTPLIVQIWVLTLVLIWAFQAWNYILEDDSTASPLALTSKQDFSVAENIQKFQSAYAANFWLTSVALSTRIWTNFRDSQSNTSLSGYFKEISFIGESEAERSTLRSNMIRENMLIIREYLNLSRSDIKWILDSSDNRRNTLESLISQLELRFKNSALSMSSLEKLKALHITELSRIDTGIEVIKGEMEKNFSESKPNGTIEKLDEYYVARALYTEHFTDIVFINQFLAQHSFLNNYNKWILDTLINNKEAIINESYVVIPDSGDEYLRPLELLFEEADFKANIQ